MSKRYYNSHALVDLTISAVFDPPLKDGKFSGGKPPKVLEPILVISVPTVIHKSSGQRFNLASVKQLDGFSCLQGRALVLVDSF